MSRVPIHDHSNIHQGGKIKAASVGGISLSAPVMGTGSGGGSLSLPIDATDVTVADAGDYFNGTDGEAVLQQIGAGTVEIEDVETYHRFLVLAHHGDMNPVDGYPENTLEGYRQAVLKGCAGFDIDLRKTSDGVWVSVHDSTLNRTTNLTGNVSSSSLATIKAGHIDGGYGYDAGRHGSSLDVPTLDEIIEALAPYDCTFWFDNKLADATSAGELAQYVVDNDLISRVRINAYSGPESDAIAAVHPLISIGGIHYGSIDYSSITSLADVTAYAPQKIFGSVLVTEFGITDEGAVAQDLYDFGARGIIANDIDAALEAAKGFLYATDEAADHIADTTDAHDASAISITDSGGYFTGTEVEAALQELGADVAAVGGGGSDHEHIVNVVFSGDASTTVWELPAAPVDSTSIAVYVTGSRSIAWALSGTMLTTLTFDSAPASASNNIVIDIVAATT